MTTLVAAGGKYYSFMGKTSPTVKDVRKELGTPAWSTNYPTPTKIRETREYRNWLAKKRYKPRLFKRIDAPRKEKPEDLKVSRCEVYRTVGRLVDDDASTLAPYGMAVGMTFFLGELADPLLLPAVVKWRMDHANDVVWLTIWYDRSGILAAWFEGNAHNPNAPTPQSSTKRPLIE